MKTNRLLKFPLLLSVLLAAPLLRADDAIFFGNSFTNHIPAIVQSIAESRGKKLDTQGQIKNGMGLEAHLGGSAADVALKSKPWIAVDEGMLRRPGPGLILRLRSG